MGCSDFLTPIPPGFVSWHGGTTLRILIRSQQTGTRSRLWAWRFILAIPGTGFDVETQDLPGSWTTPFAGMPRSSTPVGRRVLAMTGHPMLPSEITTPSAPTMGNISGLNHAAYLLAVYASQPGLPLSHARLATGLLARLWPGGTFTRWVPISTFKGASVDLLSC